MPTNSNSIDEGVRVDQLDPISSVDEDDIFITSLNGICRSVTLKGLKESMLAKKEGTPKDETIYTAADIDNKLEDINKTVNETKNIVDTMNNSIDGTINNMNNNFTELSNTINSKVDQQLDTITNKVDDKIAEMKSTVNNKLEEFNTTADQFAKKSTVVNTILPKSNWLGSEAPYIIDIEVTGVTSTNNVEVMIANTATKEEVNGWLDIGIVSGTQSPGHLVLNGYGYIPEVDIPITIIVRGDI